LGFRAGHNGENGKSRNYNFSTFFGVGVHRLPMRVPDVLPGESVASVPDDLARLYNKARRCTAAGAHTGADLLCRKMLIDMAVRRGDA